MTKKQKQKHKELKILSGQISEERDIRIQGVLKKREETLEEFLIKFFTKWNIEKNTIYVDNEKIQTQSKRRRSLGDIYKICKYYYPRCTLRQVAVLLYSTLSKKVPGFRSSYCWTINKRVWYKGDHTGFYNKTQEDEYGMSTKDWEDLLNVSSYE